MSFEALTSSLILSFFLIIYPFLLQITKLDSLQLDHLESAERDIVIAVIHKVKHIVQTDVTSTLISSICGTTPQDNVAKVACLMQMILQSSSWDEVEASITPILTSNRFQLGDVCRSTVIQVMKRCTDSSYPSSNFGDFVFDVWDMHQTDDSHATVGGQMVHDFVTKYNTNV